MIKKKREKQYIAKVESEKIIKAINFFFRENRGVKFDNYTGYRGKRFPDRKTIGIQ